MKSWISTVVVTAMMVAGLSQTVWAQAFPSKNVTMIIPFPPGGGNDIVGRYVAEKLSEKWGKPVVVENRGGAGGAIGSSSVARTTPDGYTLLFISASYTINAATLPNMTFDSVNDLSLVATAGATDMVLTVGEHVPAKSVKELLDMAKTKRMTAGTIGGAIEFATLLFIDASKINITRVPYKGAGDIFPDMLGGRIDMYVGTASAVLPLIQGKQIRPLATSGKVRIKTLPDVPTYAEIGLADAEMENWWGVFVPSKTPDAIKQRINKDVGDIMTTPQAAEFLAKQDARPKSITVPQGPELVASEIAKWKTLGDKYNVKAN